MTDWLSFYARFFASPVEAERFVEACEAQRPPNNVAKLIMHQAQRLISLAEDVPRIRPKRESLQVFFLAVCAEAVAKLHAAPRLLGSRRAVRKFFCSLVPEPHLTTFAAGFIDPQNGAIGPTAAADVLYKVRCSVAHEGNYWSFALHDGRTPMLNDDPLVTAELTPGELIEIVAHGCINAARQRL